MTSLGAAFARLEELIRENQLRYLSYRGQLLAWIKNRRARFEILTIEEIRNLRRSDTLFILGSGPSLSRVTDAQWQHVGKHDSFGMNFSFLTSFVPTYHIMEDGKEAWLREHIRQVLAPRRRALSSSIWFISNRHTRRLIHPRYAPELFPHPARVCVFRQPPRLFLESDRPFCVQDFEQTILYRGTLSLVLHLALQLGYRRIVLLGIDLHAYRHFFEEMEEMREYVEWDKRDNQARFNVADFPAFPLMIPKGSQYRRLDEYLYALKELHLARVGVELYVGNRDNILCPQIPYFGEWDG